VRTSHLLQLALTRNPLRLKSLRNAAASVPSSSSSSPLPPEPSPAAVAKSTAYLGVEFPGRHVHAMFVGEGAAQTYAHPSIRQLLLPLRAAILEKKNT